MTQSPPQERPDSLINAGVELMANWRPIETAPKDGTKCLFFAPANKTAINENAQIDQMRVDRRVERYGWRYARQHPEAPYSHWMPLPAAPKIQHSEGEER